MEQIQTNEFHFKDKNLIILENMKEYLILVNIDAWRENNIVMDKRIVKSNLKRAAFIQIDNSELPDSYIYALATKQILYRTAHTKEVYYERLRRLID